jgi:dUTP pyrophosphatase
MFQDLDDTTRGAGGFGSTGGFGPAAKKQKAENGEAVETKGDEEKKE